MEGSLHPIPKKESNQSAPLQALAITSLLFMVMELVINARLLGYLELEQRLYYWIAVTALFFF